MAHQVARLVRAQHLHQSVALLHHLLSPIIAIKTVVRDHRRFSFSSISSSRRGIDFRSQSLKLRQNPVHSDTNEDEDEDESESELPTKKSRNQKKREAKRAVKWGMDLATFTAPQIKQILKLASLDRDVFEALVLVKRMGTDVREGRRRQFNYIGRLLREVEPDLMDALIQAMKDGDHSKLQTISNTDWIMEDDVEEWDDAESEAEGQSDYIDTASRWFEGLINKDVGITKEVYSIHCVEFDRQELRKLVRRVQSMKDNQQTPEENAEGDGALVRAERSLTRFLRSLAKQLAEE
ncbi:hypothetical protein Scep_000349 [Stephania cephalantha]|uniref:Uncharacterized protein n=1 Tax=Stephania cephalantha TaxID=152367 RepID=A0AAP0Q2W8_9MAGN